MNNETVVQKRECSRIRSPIQVPIGSYFLRWLFLLKNLQFLNIQFRYFSGDKTKNILVDSLGLKKLTKTWKGHFCPCWRKNFILVYTKSTVLIRLLAKNQKYILIGSFELTWTFWVMRKKSLKSSNIGLTSVTLVQKSKSIKL